MSTPAEAPKDEKKRPKQGRSPAYPGLNLQQAIAKAKALHDAEGNYSIPMPSAFTAWGYSAKSSGGRDTRASLRYYGLITVEGDRENGKVKLTEKALRVLLDEREDQTEKKKIIRELALTPAIHKQIFDRFPDGIKSTATVEHFLVFDEKYNKSAAADVVNVFKATADYAGLYKPDNLTDITSGQATEPKPDVQKEPAKVGDFVQVEIDGALVFEQAKRVRAIQELEGKLWVFVDGEESGAPMEQVEVVEKADTAAVNIAKPPRLPLPKVEDDEPEKAGLRKSRFALSEGDVVVSFPENLSADSVEDLDGFWQVFIKKARREAGLKS